jgi:hypothetical protein
MARGYFGHRIDLTMQLRKMASSKASVARAFVYLSESKGIPKSARI